MMRRLRGICCLAGSALAALAALAVAPPAVAQGIPGGQAGVGRPGISQPVEDTSGPAPEKPDVAAKKAFTAAMKSMAKAQAFETAAAGAANPDKRGIALEKMGDAFNRALDQFTEALSNKGDMVDAWNNVGYIHLRLGAYAEAVDDYNHTLALRPDLSDAVLHRAEACLALDRLDDAKSAYMDLFNHARPLADRLMPALQSWLSQHRNNANGIRASTIDDFGKWLQERAGIANETAALPP